MITGMVRFVLIIVIAAALTSCKRVHTEDSYVVHRQSGNRAVVYDSRPELGIGAHSLDHKSLEMIKAIGIRLVRTTMYWYQIENTATPGVYDAGVLKQWDEKVATANRMGIELVMVVHGNAPGVSYAKRDEGYLRFARFMAFVTRRYPEVRYWELWNEMDTSFTDLFGASTGIPMRERGKLYARMLQTVYPMVKKDSPNVQILTGGMSDTDQFPTGIYEGGGKDYFDIMCIHTYGVPVYKPFIERGRSVRAIMVKYGDGSKPLWNTEFGIDAGNIVAAWGYPHNWAEPKNDAEAFDEVHLQQWKRCLEEAAESGIYQKVLGYQFKAPNERNDDGKISEKAQLPPGQTIDDYGFGIVRSDMSPRPLYDWLKATDVNRSTREKPRYVANVLLPGVKMKRAVGYRSQQSKDGLIVRNVPIDSLFPTIIRLRSIGD